MQANSPSVGVNQPVILDGFIRNDIGLGGVHVSTSDPDVHNLITILNIERFPGLNFRPTIVNFGSVPLGETQVRSLTIENSVGMSVNVSFPASPAGLFKWEAFSGVLADGAEEDFEMEFRPTSSAIERETLIVTSTAPGSPHSIGLIGKGPGGFPTPGVEPNGPIG